ncbi:hypothetical protein [Iodobacter fluviatilis]|uniref:Uncharacterized protein n=1 Tax=Iodobacter fluviatilis TaxID=537 RepID=A0A377Q1R5_9NEIS|nr:hypothetical protein [Iodobacter fluviatilis]TCU90179.1 hypothetical protein EV682_101200 [Iodobacter fluviatilis]STQ89206.1 Uncharacterised protein [Iodobacter fluviatilis]
MSFFNVDLKEELGQIESALNRTVTNSLKPAIDDSVSQAADRLEATIGKASVELHSVVANAGNTLSKNIKDLSDEIHNQRSMTKDDIIEIVNYASKKIGDEIDQRILKIKDETSSLINEKVSLLKTELEDATIKSRKMLFTNLAISGSSALLMAVIGFVYKKITIGQLDPFILFRIILVSCAVGAGLMSGLKMWQSWRAKSTVKRGIATTVFSFVGVLRPNGAMALFLLSMLLLAAWAWLTLHA